MDQHKGLPRLALKHFAGPDGKVWTYDKATGKRWPAKPGRTGVEAHYFSVERRDGSMDTTLEDLLSALEGEVAPIYERLARGLMPRGSDREAFGHFLGVTYARTPAMRRMAASVHKAGLESRLAFTAQHPQAFAAMLKRMARDGIDVSDPDFIRNIMTDLSHSDLVLPKEWVLKTMSHAHKFCELFLRMKWSLARAQHHYFITCDTPIHLAVDPKTMPYAYGLANRTAEITFPISTKRILMLHWEHEAPFEIELPRDWVRNENTKRAYCADREVYAHIEHKAIQRLVDRFKGKRIEMRSTSLADKGFGEVIVPRRWSTHEKTKRKAGGSRE